MNNSIIHSIIVSVNLWLPRHQARAYLSPEELLKGEVSESLLKVQTTLEVLQLFRHTYEEQRAGLDRYRRDGREVRPWDFSPLMVFVGPDRFLFRVWTTVVGILTLSSSSRSLILFPISDDLDMIGKSKNGHALDESTPSYLPSV